MGTRQHRTPCPVAVSRAPRAPGNHGSPRGRIRIRKRLCDFKRAARPCGSRPLHYIVSARSIPRRSGFAGRHQGATAEKAVPFPAPRLRIEVAIRAEKRSMERRRTDELLDLALEQTFPASDPPFFMAGAAIIGRPNQNNDDGALASRAGAVNCRRGPWTESGVLRRKERIAGTAHCMRTTPRTA